MENQFRAIARNTGKAAPRQAQRAEDARLAHTNDARLAQAASEELLLMGMPRVNVLLAGRNDVVRPVLHALLGKVQKPIVSWCPGEPLALPPIERTGTLVLQEVGELGLREQIQLLEWSGRAMGNTQVISTTSAALLPRVGAGAFIDTLYYRLNTVYVDVTGLEEAA
jgi:hypothetical protein